MATGSPNFAINPNDGVGSILSAGDISPTNPASLVNVLTAGASGSRIERLSFSGLGTTIASVIRLFLFDGTSAHKYAEIPVPSFAAIPSIGSPAWGMTLEAVSAPDLMPLVLKTGWSLRATINDTQLITESTINSIALAQTLGSATFLSINGALATAASANAISSLAAPSANAPVTLTTSPFILTAPAQVTLTSSGNNANQFMIVGRDATGATISETLTGPNSSTVYTANVYKVVLAVIPETTSGATLSVGFSPVADFGVPTSKIILFSGSNLSATNFTIVGAGANGAVSTETLAGPNIGFVTSANIYGSITSIKSSAAIATQISVGNPAILGGVSIVPMAGDY